MPSLTKPQGPLPDAVYWRRRALVLAVALILVVGLGRLLGSGSDATDTTASDANGSLVSSLEAAVPSISESAAVAGPPTVTGSATPEEDAAPGKAAGAPDEQADGAQGEQAQGEKPARKKKAQRPQPVEPDGECAPSDVVVEPKVADQPAGRDIKVRLHLSTETSPACTWTASEETLTLKITSGDDSIWFSSECPKAMPKQDVVLRNDQTTVVHLRWDARRSDEGCTPQRLWALPGTYHLGAAALGGEPATERFLLDTPTSETITAEPENEPSKKKGAERRQREAEKKSEG